MKQEILNTATSLFLNIGFKSITMDDIAQEMAISKKTIYSHYAHKTDLVEDASMQLLEKILKHVNEIIAQDHNPIEEIYEIKKYVLQHLKGENSSPVQQLQKYYVKIYSKIKQRQFDHMQKFVESNLSRGIAQGLYREDLTVAFVSRIYFIGITGIKNNEIFDPADFPPGQLHEVYLEYHLRAIVTSKGRNILDKLINSN